LKNIINLYFLLLITVGYSQQNFSLSILSDISFSNKDSTFNSSGVELVGMGKPYPNIMIMAYLHFPFNNDKVSIEEVFLDLKNNLDLKLGYFRPNIGFLNKTHKHTYNFISSPNSIKYLIGDHSWSSLGISAGYELPLKWKNQISINILKNTIGEESKTSFHDHNFTNSIQDTINNQLAYGLIFKQGFIINNQLKVKTGFNHINGREKSMNGISFQLRNDTNQYKFWLIQGEFFKANISDYHNGLSYHPNEKLVSKYLLLGRQFNKNFHLGFIFDQWIYDLKDFQGSSKSLYISFAPKNDDFVVRFKISENETIYGRSPLGIIQLNWSLGPHTPQRY